MTDAPHTDDPNASDDVSTGASNVTDNNTISKNSKNPNIYWENAINISKRSTTPKKIKNITDALDGDANIPTDGDAADVPNTADDDAGSVYSKTSL